MNRDYEEVSKKIKEVKDKNLYKLDLGKMNLKELPKEVFELINLKELELYGNKNLNFPKEIVKLENLELLSFSNLSYFPEEILELKYLKNLALLDGKIEEIPSDIDKLKNLEIFWLNNNELSNLPTSLLNLKKLKRLHLINNQKLNIYDEILETENPKEILNYYFNLQKAEKEKLAEAKILFVGQGNVGKTSLVKSLFYGEYNENELMTDGIKIEKFLQEELTLNLWDFGGQEIMHTTHQFFLTKRSLYVLVLSAMVDDEFKRTEYWLKLISSFGGESPVIIVLNKIDDGNKEIGNKEIDENRLKRKYPQIKAVVKTSCKSQFGIKELKETIVKEVKELPRINEIWIKEWFEVKEYLENQKEKGMDFIPYSKFKKLCEEKEIDELSQKTLIEYLHDLGVVLNFRETNLNSSNILNPVWVTNGIYKIINSEVPKDGILKIEDSEVIFNQNEKYPKDKFIYIIEMMKKFELLFDFKDNYLIPELLPKKEPKLNFDFEKNLTFIYYYDYLPTSIISRFITKANEFILDEFFWKNGVVIKYEELIALVLLDEFDKTLSIFIDGENKKKFLTMIRHQINEINLTLSSLEISQKIVRDGIKVSFEHLLKLEKKGINEFLPENSDEILEVKVVLDGIIEEEERTKEIKEILNNIENGIGNESAKVKRKNQYLIQNVSKDISNTKEKEVLPFAIKQFKIENYQSIKSLSMENIPIDSKWIFITGYNGAGKSAILQALALGLVGINFKMNEDFKVAVELNTPNGAKLNNIVHFINHWNEPDFKLNNFVSYGASRLSISVNDERDDSIKHLFESESKLANIERWIIKKELEKLKGDQKSETILNSAIELLTELLPDIDKIEIEGSEVKYIERNTKVNLNELSHGHKSIVAMIGDLILRLIEVDSHIKNFKDFKAIVFIDEFETHLHPIWQIDFVKKLSDSFPNVQFWVTTHSPLPFIKAPKGSTILKVERDEKDNSTIIKNLDIDVSVLSPDMILTSPFFDVETLKNPKVEDEKVRSESNYQEMVENDNVDEFIRKKLHSLNIDKNLFKDLKDDN